MEVWKNIIGFDGYQISNEGRVKSLAKTYKSGKNGCIVRHQPEIIMKLQVNKKKYTSYYQIFLTNKKRFYVHRLVAIHFIPNPENKKYINHKDGNGLNNNDWNIEWSTRSENTIHSVQILKRKIGNKSKRK